MVFAPTLGSESLWELATRRLLRGRTSIHYPHRRGAPSGEHLCAIVGSGLKSAAPHAAAVPLYLRACPVGRTAELE